MPTIKQYFTLKKITLFLTILLPIFFILFLVGGCSFKLIDPQYYEFKKLCANVDSEVEIYNQDYWDIIKNHNDIKTNTKGCFYSEKLKQEICFGYFHEKTYTDFDKGRLSKIFIKRYYKHTYFATKIGYNYQYFGLWLKGDEGAGWHWETKDTLICEELRR